MHRARVAALVATVAACSASSGGDAPSSSSNAGGSGGASTAGSAGKASAGRAGQTSQGGAGAAGKATAGAGGATAGTGGAAAGSGGTTAGAGGSSAGSGGSSAGSGGSSAGSGGSSAGSGGSSAGSGGAKAGAGGSTAGAGGSAVSLPGGVRATWLWGSSVVKTPAETATFFAFASTHALDGVYVEAQSLIPEAPAALEAFVAAAKAKGVEVELLFGYEIWARASEHAKAVALAQSAVTFTQGLAGAKPTGVHFDVEPHQLAEWKAGGASEAQIAGEFIDLLEKLRAVTGGTGLRLSVDIPFWYDGRTLTRGNVTKPLSEWVADSVDRVVLMDYRDTADGSDGIIAQAATELAYATTKGKEVVIGVETLCNLDPPKITFCEEGQAALEAELAKTRAASASQAGFAGLAVHDYKAYAALKP